MTVDQEDALYDFLDNATEAFSTIELAAEVRRKGGGGSRRLVEELIAFLISRKLAFPVKDTERWISRRGFFSPARFTLTPSRLEIRNGIFIPGHRFLPFANPLLLPHELSFSWKGEPIPATTSEGPPEDFYPFYELFGEEYAPQYLARDNPENEEAFNADAYEDPPEISVRTLDMRAIYRELGFVPGNRLIARTLDWKGGVFELEPDPNKKMENDALNKALAEWESAAERGFLACFDSLGPCASTEEQVAFAFWFGGSRLLEIPARSLEEYLYEKTERIEIVPYGMETRFWRAGKEIPDSGPWTMVAGPPDKTEFEALLAKLGVPVSEYVAEAFVRDALFRKDSDIHRILERLLPPSIELTRTERMYIAQFLAETRDDLAESYNFFADHETGPLRSRVAELHTAIVDLAARLSAREDDRARLPKHANVTLSQLQNHAANLLEDLDFDEVPDARELAGMENSLDAMIDSYEDLKEAIETARDDFRRRRFTLVQAGSAESVAGGKVLQISLSGTGVWRRVIVPADFNLAELHVCIQAIFGWSGGSLHGFMIDGQVYGPESDGGELAERETTISDLATEGITDFVYDYDYGSEWEARVILLHETQQLAGRRPRCAAGEGMAPPEKVGGPLRYRRFVSALKSGAGNEKRLALSELGDGFDPDAFTLETVESALKLAFPHTAGEEE